MRLLLLSPFLPSQGSPHGGGRVLFEMIGHLAERHEIGLLSFFHPEDTPEAISHLEGLCASVRTVPRDIFHIPPALRIANAFSATPAWHVQTSCRDMVRALRHVLRESRFDAVQVELVGMAHYVRQIDHPCVVLNSYEAFGRSWLHKAVEQGWGPLTPYLLWDFARLARREARLLRAFRGVLAFSPEDRAYYLSKSPGARVHTWSPGIELPAPAPDADGDVEGNDARLLFVGAFLHPPNIRGIRYFCKQVLPRILERVPRATLDIVGPDPPASVQVLEGPRVRVHGYVDDLAPFRRGRPVMIVPILRGGGIRIKLLEALARGLPVVSTSAGAEGVEGRSGEHLFLADDPADFARCVVTLLADPDLRDRMGRSGRALVESRHSWPRAVRRLEALYEEILAGP